jgi:dipeptidyl aminopeptidase/acylaminoacyl peptidase
MRALLYAAVILMFGALLGAQTTARHAIQLDDIFRMEDVREPQVSPDGKWIVYTVGTVDKENDKRPSNLWMVSWDGTQDIQLTYSPESESTPRWSPDGRWLSFVSSRPGKAKGSQIWLMDRRGGEPRQFTAFKENEHILGYEWSPDSKRMVVAMRESDDPNSETAKSSSAPPPPPKPLVIDRYHFKQDEEGYIAGFHYSRLYLLDVATQKLERLTNFKRSDEDSPVWSPDGSRIAFVSNQDEDPDRSEHTDIWVVDAHPDATPRRLTTYKGTNGGKPSWSPDGKLIAYVQGTEPKYTAYNLNRLAVVATNGSSPAQLISSKLDRGVTDPLFSPDGKSVVALVEDDRSEYPARFELSGDSYKRLISGKLVINSQSIGGSHIAVTATTDAAPPEIFALDEGSMRQLTHHNDALLSTIQLSPVEDFSCKSPDGTEVHGLLTLPPGHVKGKRYPTLLRIHGGPNGQDEHEFMADHQFLAAAGYVVVSVNYRGSSGRGQKFSESIFNDWGHLEVEDLLAAMDYVQSAGIADPDHLGIGGWSYGGILTDYTIATDGRFKAAIAGAGSANQISMYGSDEYVFQYDSEVGPPWKNPEGWLKLSYPFFKADRIHTPTLFLGGDQDFNVPVIGGEQMYQALKTLNVPTELVIYPGAHHAIHRPSYQRDRLQRYVAWYDRYLKAPPTASTR